MDNPTLPQAQGSWTVVILPLHENNLIYEARDLIEHVQHIVLVDFS